MKTYKCMQASLLIEHQIANCISRKKSCDQSSNCPTIWSSKKVDANSGSLNVLGHPMSMVKLPMLSTARPEEENPDHGKWDTYVM